MALGKALKPSLLPHPDSGISESPATNLHRAVFNPVRNGFAERLPHLFSKITLLIQAHDALI